jgi:hypothetical protein
MALVLCVVFRKSAWCYGVHGVMKECMMLMKELWCFRTSAFLCQKDELTFGISEKKFLVLHKDEQLDLTQRHTDFGVSLHMMVQNGCVMFQKNEQLHHGQLHLDQWH